MQNAENTRPNVRMSEFLCCDWVCPADHTSLLAESAGTLARRASEGESPPLAAPPSLAHRASVALPSRRAGSAVGPLRPNGSARATVLPLDVVAVCSPG